MNRWIRLKEATQYAAIGKARLIDLAVSGRIKGAKDSRLVMAGRFEISSDRKEYKYQTGYWRSASDSSDDVNWIPVFRFYPEYRNRNFEH